MSHASTRRSRVRASARARRPHSGVPSPPQLRLALVSTMAQNAATLDSFVCYYLALGVAPLLLYVDDAADAALRVARRYPPGRVVVRVRDAALRREWRDLPSWARLELYADSEVQARQQLNCEHAARAAAAAGADYLLHVDSDELLYFPRAAAGAGGAAAALGAHLRALAARGALQFTYRNLEAVPEAEECADALRAVSLFKQHPAELHAAPPSAGAAAALRHWGDGDHHFRFYTNGKSLVAL